MTDWEKWTPTEWKIVTEGNFPVISLNDGVKAYILVSGPITIPHGRHQIREAIMRSILERQAPGPSPEEISALWSENSEMRDRLRFLEETQGKFAPGQEVYRKSTGDGPFVLIAPMLVAGEAGFPDVSGWAALKGAEKFRLPVADLTDKRPENKSGDTIGTIVFDGVITLLVTAVSTAAAFSWFFL